jgi:hypothetical protein
MKMSFIKKIEIPLTIVSILILISFIDYTLAIPGLPTLVGTFETWATLIAAFALLIGCINLSVIHINRVYRRDQYSEWYLSVYMLVLIVVIYIIGMFLGQNSGYYLWILNNLYSPISQGTYGIMAIYYTAAIYKSIRIRNFQTLLIATLIVIVALWHSPIINNYVPVLSDLGNWVIRQWLVSGRRSSDMAWAIGSIILTIRIILQFERNLLGVESGGQ